MLLMIGIDQHSGCKDPGGNEFSFTHYKYLSSFESLFFQFKHLF